ncbi:DUF7668 domain-containing protein [Archangium sp.]|uniref:DUF7668 domain-containing protein n=1 Tax=Archangium sp. TaxID=1872627 RepID=UPI003BB93370
MSLRPYRKSWHHNSTVHVTGASPPLWTREEGRSDLTLSVTAIKQGETYTVEVDDLHVL